LNFYKSLLASIRLKFQVEKKWDSSHWQSVCFQDDFKIVKKGLSSFEMFSIRHSLLPACGSLGKHQNFQRSAKSLLICFKIIILKHKISKLSAFLRPFQASIVLQYQFARATTLVMSPALKC